MDLEVTQTHDRRFLETVEARAGVERENESAVLHGGQSQLQKQVYSLGRNLDNPRGRAEHQTM